MQSTRKSASFFTIPVEEQMQKQYHCSAVRNKKEVINNDKVASAVLLEAFLAEGESAVLTKALWQLFNLNIQILNGYILESLNPYKRIDENMTD